MKRKRTREEERLRRAATLLRFAVLMWIAVVLLCLLEPRCFAMDAAAATATGTDPTVTWLAAVGAAWLTWRAMALVLKLDEPRGKRARRR